MRATAEHPTRSWPVACYFKSATNDPTHDPVLSSTRDPYAGSGISGTDTPPRSPATVLPEAAPPGVDSLFAGYPGPANLAGLAAASSAPSSGRGSPALGADATASASTAAAAAAAAAEAHPEQPSMLQPAGSGSAPDLHSVDMTTAVRYVIFPH